MRRHALGAPRAPRIALAKRRAPKTMNTPAKTMPPTTALVAIATERTPNHVRPLRRRNRHAAAEDSPRDRSDRANQTLVATEQPISTQPKIKSNTMLNRADRRSRVTLRRAS
jgi:hypothetical protein